MTTTAQHHVIELITRMVHHADPAVPVLPYTSTSWLDRDNSAVYVAVESATVNDDGWIEGSAVLTAPERLDVTAPEVPSYYGQIRSVQPGTTTWGAGRPAVLYGTGFVLTALRKSANLGHVSRQRIHVAGWLPSSVAAWPEGPQVDSLRNVIADLGTQQPPPNLDIDRAMRNGSQLSVAVKPGSDDLEYAVSVFTRYNEAIDSGMNIATSGELEEYLQPHVHKLSVPGIGTLTGVRSDDSKYVSLTFSRTPIGDEN